MKIKTIIVTMWFDKYNDIKDIYGVLGQKLDEYFPNFIMNNLSANIDPTIPRITSRSKSGHSIFNMSNINVQVATKFDDNYNEDFDSCIEYIKVRAKKIYNVLREKNINVLYSAILVNLNKDEKNPIASIQKKLLSPNIANNTLSEVGMRISMQIDNTFYRIITVNNSKDYSMQKQINPGKIEIILPLISLRNAKMKNEYVAINYELNDKYSFDTIENYSCNPSTFDKMFNIVESDIKSNIEHFLNTGEIS